MRPPTRTTRSKANPGLVDCPSSRRSSATVAEEKAKKQQAATLKTDELRRRAAQVGEVEQEIRRAQGEAQSVRQRSGGKVAKKTFPRPGGDANVSFSDLCMSVDLQLSCLSLRLPTAGTGYKGCSKQEER